MVIIGVIPWYRKIITVLFSLYSKISFIFSIYIIYPFLYLYNRNLCKKTHVLLESRFLKMGYISKCGSHKKLGNTNIVWNVQLSKKIKNWAYMNLMHFEQCSLILHFLDKNMSQMEKNVKGRRLDRWYRD